MPRRRSEPTSEPPVMLLRSDVWHARMLARNHATIAAQARAVRCARSSLYEVVSGRAEPRRDLVWRMARAAGTTPARLFRLADA